VTPGIFSKIFPDIIFSMPAKVLSINARLRFGVKGQA
jgi:hypothetical protein